MGLLSHGKPLSWEESAPHREKVKNDGVTQFLNAYEKTKDRYREHLKWGDEVEYQLVKMDPQARRARLCLRAPELIAQLQQPEAQQVDGVELKTLWRPEYAIWMVEGTPGTPYKSTISDLTKVQRNMGLRRAEIKRLLKEGESVLTLTAFPRLGCRDFTDPAKPVYGKYARSFYTSDEHINPHPRFPTLTRNIRLRRGSKVDIRMPIYNDMNTVEKVAVIDDQCDEECLAKTEEDLQNDTAYDKVEDLRDAATDNVYMDSMAFGMGCCCLQVTLQARDIDECRLLYDQLNVLAPVMLAMSAASPILRGYLLDTDVRWNVIAASVDDRTPEERTEDGDKEIKKSRYDSIDVYISGDDRFNPGNYNDVPIRVNEKAYKRLLDAGIDEALACHVSHLFIRDPLVIFEDLLEQDNDVSLDHFENIQSTNWNTVRFKPPPPQSDIGWRTEFRSMEVQLTDFENAAFSIFIVLISRVILAFKLNLYIPISKVDMNMHTAHDRVEQADAQRPRFYFRKDIFIRSADGRSIENFQCSRDHEHNVGTQFPVDQDCDDNPGKEFELMSLNDIFNGKSRGDSSSSGYSFPGLIPLIRLYLKALQIDESERETLTQINAYLDFISERASGELMTTAQYIRKFVMNHPAYKGDSVVSEEINYDLVRECQMISCGEKEAPELLGHMISSKPLVSGPESYDRFTTLAPEGSHLRGASLTPSAYKSYVPQAARRRIG
mmetsp:Transcript_10903/g.33424  ORF Transcript_10903/g.33424 Transcript_10903/m.33424 type:complete len:721 (-) Transcript_10903:921-3083(-)